MKTDKILRSSAIPGACNCWYFCMYVCLSVLRTLHRRTTSIVQCVLKRSAKFQCTFTYAAQVWKFAFLDQHLGTSHKQVSYNCWLMSNNLSETDNQMVRPTIRITNVDEHSNCIRTTMCICSYMSRKVISRARLHKHRTGLTAVWRCLPVARHM